ncbi:tRNA(Met) cytidine acetyltransferase TmcA [Halobium salinum]|uniref:tRNA(Met) cytidine acetyltransferase TmcA n=1 Tax=Halobium salinum TaxID=1364940 RepID=A0ABD5P854_9EURY|nr:tRNA(Met) cytidine acetyltransferase TmcA [Halobium salinum]
MSDDPRSPVETVARDLRAAAVRDRQRRLLVFAGDRDAGIDAAYDALAAAGFDEAADGDGDANEATDGNDDTDEDTDRDGDDEDAVTIVTTREGFRYDRVDPVHAGELLGTTRDAVVLDCHEGFSPNALGRVVGAVDAGGLLVLLTPPLDEWPDRRDEFDEGLAVPPFSVDDVDGRFRRRLVATLRNHPGVAVVDVDEGAVERAPADDPGLTLDYGGRRPAPPTDAAFPAAAYRACLTADQGHAVAELEALLDPGHAVVVEADRGRGKSSAAGIAAGALAAAGKDVLVTAPRYRNAREVFARARALLAAPDLDALAGAGPDPEHPRTLTSTSGGRVRFAPPPAAATLPEDPDVVIVDEAAALPVRLLARFLDAPSVAFATTVHGYEGAGRGFSVRFRDRLGDSGLAVSETHLDKPIRYAAGDPVESWAFRALLLDARPPVKPLVVDATLDSVSYRELDPETLLADEHRLREAFGLLVLAHYRTEPDDLARLLDAPNLTCRALCHDGHVVSVALLAREGALDADTRRRMYDGGRIRGNMLPDVFTSQLRDEAAGVPVGYRVMRIATHHAVRSRGFGSRLLDEVEAELGTETDWLGVGYGATPELLRFWDRNGFDTVHLSTSRNDTSGEYSALMLRPTSDAGRDLRERHDRWFRGRVAGVLSDPLRDLDADVARAALGATAGVSAPDLDDRGWRIVVDSSYGPGLYSTHPEAFRRVALAHLTDPGSTGLDPREERLLVRKVLQGESWDAVADELDYVSTGQCMRALGDAFRPLVDRYGTAFAHDLRGRYEK